MTAALLLPTMIKLVGEDRFEGYGVVFGDADHRDLHREYFTKQTDYALDMWPTRPALYDHGLDPDIGPNSIGVIDTIKADSIGIWLAGQWDKAHRYLEFIKELARKGVLGWSTGTLPALKRVVAGQIVKWPIAEGSMTTQPAQPPKSTKTYVTVLLAAMKSVGISPDALEALQEADALVAQDSDVQSDEASKAVPVETTSPTPEKEQTMPTVEELAVEVTNLRADTTSIKSSIDLLLSRFPATPPTTPTPVPEAPLGGTPTKSLQPLTPPPAPTPVPTGIPAPQNPQRIDVTRATKYSDFSASDMSFLADFMSSNKNWEATEEFQREYADKVGQAVRNNQLPGSVMKFLPREFGGGGAIKSNEVGGTGQAGGGTEWVADSWRAELWSKTRQDNVVAPLFNMIEMPTNPYELPLENNDPTVSYVPETTDQSTISVPASPIPASTIGTAKVTMSAKKLALMLVWSAEYTEDSIIPVLAQYRGQSIRAMQNAIDYVILNGDTVVTASTNINIIDGTPTAKTKYLAFDGLRKAALAQAGTRKDGLTGAPTLSLMRNTRFLLSGAYALRPRDCAFIVDDSTYAKLLNLPEFSTMDKAGVYSTNLTGQLGVLDGVPVFATAEMGLSNTAGKINSVSPSTNNIYGQALCVFRPNWFVGYRRQVRATVEFNQEADAYVMVITARLTLAKFDTSSASILFDVAV